jgi:glycosyltransferase involved in cell wall biosynthesis
VFAGSIRLYSFFKRLLTFAVGHADIPIIEGYLRASLGEEGSTEGRKEDATSESLSMGFMLSLRSSISDLRTISLMIKGLMELDHDVTVYVSDHDDKNKLELIKNNKVKLCLVDNAKEIPEQADIPDIIVFTDARQLKYTADFTFPLAFWELGEVYMYGDYGFPFFANDTFRDDHKQLFSRPDIIFTVSDSMIERFSAYYDRKAFYVPKPVEITDTTRSESNDVVILVEGDSQQPRGGVGLAFRALLRANEMGANFSVTWITNGEPANLVTPFPLSIVSSSEKKSLGDSVFANADIFLCVSLYDAFPIDALEAMAAGTAVISVDNDGINMFGKPGENCLICEPSDIDGMGAAIAYLASNPQARIVLANESRKMAGKFKYKHVAKVMANQLMDVVGTRKERAIHA